MVDIVGVFSYSVASLMMWEWQVMTLAMTSAKVDNVFSYDSVWLSLIGGSPVSCL
jgi:hypothetical protein